jgi:hypothetical protein
MTGKMLTPPRCPSGTPRRASSVARRAAAASEEGAAAVRGKRVTPARRKQLREHLATARKKVRREQWDETGWTEEQIDLLGTDHDEVIAKRIGRTPNAVRLKRLRLKIPAFDYRSRRADQRGRLTNAPRSGPPPT